MTRSIWSLVVCTQFLALVLSASSQSPAAPSSSQSETYSLKVRSQIVLLDVVVTDRKGKLVTNLGRNDFTVYEDKVPQTLTSVDPPQPQHPGSAPSIQSTAQLDKAEPNAPVSIIVMDEINTRFEDEAFARYSLKKYLNTQGDALLQPSMLVAVTPSRFMVLRDYTTSKNEILSALDHHLAAFPWKATDASWRGERFNAAFSSLMEVAEATSGHPGHKNMIWIGRGFPMVNPLTLTPQEEKGIKDLIATCTDMLRSARVTLYAVDPAGLSVRPAATDTSGFYEEDPFGGQFDFSTMAEATGGKSFYGRNDVDNLIGMSARGGIDFYTLAYTPASSTGTAKPFRNIHVVLKDPSLTASTRLGYYVDPPAPPPDLQANGQPSDRMRFDLAVAIQGLIVYDGVPLAIARDPAAPDTFHLQVGSADIPWKPLDQDSRQADLTVLVRTFDRSGKVLASTAKLLTVKSPQPAPGGSALPPAVNLVETVSTQPPAARIRFVVRVNGTGRLAADNVFLVDPATLSKSSTGLDQRKH